MSRIDIGQSITNPKVVPATARGFYQAADSEKTGRICAELEDALEQHRRGELTKEEYKDVKAAKKKGCKFYTPHAHFKNGYKRRDGGPQDSGKAVIDLDGCEHFEQLYEQHLKGHERELGINMVNISVSRTGGHILFDIPEGLTRQQAQAWMAGECLGGVAYDKAVHERERAVYIPCRSYILYLDEELMFADQLHPATLSQEVLAKYKNGVKKEVKEEVKEEVKGEVKMEVKGEVKEDDTQAAEADDRIRFIARGVMKEKQLEPSDFLREGGRHTTVKIFLSGASQLLTKAETNAILAELMPEHWQDENIRQLVSDFYQNYTKPTQRLLRYQEQLFAQSQRMGEENSEMQEDFCLENAETPALPRMPQGVRDSIEAVGPALAIPVVAAICPAIGALATGVRLDVHGTKNSLNLISYIAGDFASGKGGIDPVVEAWMSEQRALDVMYQMQEDEWRAKKRAAKNKKEQPEEPKLPVRFLTLNNTVANLAERLANTGGKHAFSFTPEADTVAQKWKSSLSDFSVMLRQSYDGTRYDREARSADAVNVHIERLLWNVTMCGTPDALYRVVNNYTDGFQSRIAVVRTPDNTFAPLQEKPAVLSARQTGRIQQIAHLLPLMQGEVVLPKLEQHGREWVEKIRLETMKNDDRVKARQRFRICVTAQRMTCCLMLCRVCETLIQKHGTAGAEAQLKQSPGLWKEMLLKAQTEAMFTAYDIIADALIENALFFFRDRIENAFCSRDYAAGRTGERTKRGKNDSIYERLDVVFTFEQAMQQSIAVKGAGVTRNSVHQMLKNWRNQGIAEQTNDGRFRKVLSK